MKAQAKIGNFINKLQSLLDNHHYSHIIHWTDHKTVIEICNLDKMQKEIIPLYFRHCKFQSFVRQLNLYGFRKLKAQGKHRFTHQQLQLGNGLASVTSVKCGRVKEGQESGKGGVNMEGKASENAGLLDGSWRKVGGSAFRVYNPENRSNILLVQKMEEGKERQPMFEGQNTHPFVLVPSNSYFMWNFMDFFNKNILANQLTASQSQSQPEQIMQQ